MPRMPEYLSPSSLKAYEKDADEFYMKYLAENRPPRLPQTQPMSVGSAFDAYIKCYFHQKIRAAGGRPCDPIYDKQKLFESQVEAHNRAWAAEAGQHVFDKFVKMGAASDMLLRFSNSLEEPRFEFEVRGTVGGVPMMGKPDIKFCAKIGENCLGVIDDFKVNGYCGTAATSPKAGYVQLIDESGRRFGQHKKVIGIQSVGGLHINTSCNMEDIDEEWAMQLATYGWLLGETPGTDFIVGIQQIVCDGRGVIPGGQVRPGIKVATFCNRVGKNFQLTLLARYQGLWQRITSGWTNAALESKAKILGSGTMEADIASWGREQRPY